MKDVRVGITSPSSLPGGVVVIMLVSLLVPSSVVRAGCCMPDRFKGVMTVDGYLDRANFEANFEDSRLIARPRAPNSPVKYVLFDFGAGLVHTRYKPGFCRTDIFWFPKAVKKCVPDSAELTKNSTTNKAPIERTWKYKTNDEQTTVTTTVKAGNCFPIMIKLSGQDNVWVGRFDNVITNKGYSSKVDTKVSDCKPSGDIFG